MNRFKNKLALITGASKGIGKSIAIGLAQESSNILFTYFRDKQNAEKTKSEVLRLGVKCEMIKINLSDVKEVEKITAHIKDNYKSLDFLINNAATGININSDTSKCLLHHHLTHSNHKKDGRGCNNCQNFLVEHWLMG